MNLCKRMMKKFSLLFFWCKSFILFELFSSERNQLGFECKERAENMCCVWFQRKFLTITFPFICSHRVLWVNLVLDYYFMYMYDRRQLQNKELNERARNEIVYERNLIWFFFSLVIIKRWEKKRNSSTESEWGVGGKLK